MHSQQFYQLQSNMNQGPLPANDGQIYVKSSFDTHWGSPSLYQAFGIFVPVGDGRAWHISPLAPQRITILPASLFPQGIPLDSKYYQVDSSNGQIRPLQPENLPPPDPAREDNPLEILHKHHPFQYHALLTASQSNPQLFQQARSLQQLHQPQNHAITQSTQPPTTAPPPAIANRSNISTTISNLQATPTPRQMLMRPMMPPVAQLAPLSSSPLDVNGFPVNDNHIHQIRASAASSADPNNPWIIMPCYYRAGPLFPLREALLHN